MLKVSLISLPNLNELIKINVKTFHSVYYVVVYWIGLSVFREVISAEENLGIVCLLPIILIPWERPKEVKSVLLRLFHFYI